MCIMGEDDTISWNVDLEVNLFHAMRKHKPVGVTRHFQMLYIQDKLNSAIGHNISADQIWQHLSQMYDLQALNESEIIPFPNKEEEFVLPENEFSSLLELDYPRCSSKPSDSTHTEEKYTRQDSKDKDKDGGGKSSKNSERHSETKADDLSKREHRKRTRQATQSPAPLSEPSSKRARRT